MTPDEIAQSIMEGNVSALQAIKGIGGKTAQRIIVDLKDKIGVATGLSWTMFGGEILPIEVTIMPGAEKLTSWMSTSW
jgi:ATP-dependent Lon protease